MSLGKCRECGREVSKSAAVCPGCGVKGPVRASLSWARIALGVVAVIVLAKVCSSKPTAEPTSYQAALSTPAAQGTSAPTQAPAPMVVKPAAPLPALAAGTLIQAYKANAVAADRKYKGNRYHVTGRVAAIDSTLGDTPSVRLGSEYDYVIVSGVRAAFAATLNKGDTFEDEDCEATGSVIGTPTLDCDP